MIAHHPDLEHLDADPPATSAITPFNRASTGPTSTIRRHFGHHTKSHFAENTVSFDDR
jgi:hypothetical protein